MAELSVRVQGIRPLLTHNPAAMSTVKESSKESNIPEPEIEAERGTYRLPNGAFALPGVAFRNSLLSAAGAWRVERGKGFMRARLSHIEVKEELVGLIDPTDGTPLTSYTIDKRRAVIKRSGAVIRCRPRFEQWGAQFVIIYDELLVFNPTKTLAGILGDAGMRIGVGDFRPEKNGWFGRYTVVEAVELAVGQAA